MNRRGDYGSLSERVTRHHDQTPAAPPPIKHCWVTDSNGRLPGLLLEWRRRPDGWHGRVVRPLREDNGWHVVEEWLPASLLVRA